MSLVSLRIYLGDFGSIILIWAGLLKIVSFEIALLMDLEFGFFCAKNRTQGSRRTLIFLNPDLVNQN